MKRFRVLTTGGGTAGHIYPIAAVVAELQTMASEQQVNLEVRYLGAYGSFKGFLEENNIRVQRVANSKLRRHFNWQNFIDVPKLVWSVFQSLWKVYWFMPDVLFSKGGPGSLAVVLAARFYCIPIIVHESDAIPSITTRITSKFANVVAVSFASTTGNFPNKEVIHTGNPIRKYLLTDPISKEKGRGYFGFNPSEPLVLILGGSQGSTSINDFILDVLPDLVKSVQVLHQTGKEDYQRIVHEAGVALEKLPEEMQVKYKAIDYFEKDIRIAYQGADLVISRAGASATCEIAAFGKPSILIPLPWAANDHQRANAAEYQKLGAAIVMEQDNLLPHIFLNNVAGLLANQEKLVAMGEAAKGFYKSDAASNLAQVILRYI
ncbi:MAG: UDP-N-acetylglucosamine--N-acetylmuramyl-(pentapeptide) pyrophosphoryl-undecaprenol N-acetylglucosamine transferase [Candidatus Colwellbacteria bacterium]|nr:UDP-N-acetylglucosamine--N-acetylmuramyl-(pentapeptide) pyrophosphoryl-undecaprenol N-acetylglucosamine transferase [Candidatus Colwellbacteria bacterium]